MQNKYERQNDSQPMDTSESSLPSRGIKRSSTALEAKPLEAEVAKEYIKRPRKDAKPQIDNLYKLSHLELFTHFSAISYPYSIDVYSALLSELDYRLPRASNNEHLIKLIQVASAQLDNFINYWAQVGISPDDRQTVRLITKIINNWGHLSSLESINIPPFSIQTFERLFFYTARSSSVSAAHIASCFQGLSGLVKKNKVTHSFSALQVNSLLDKLSIDFNKTSQDISQSLSGVSWLARTGRLEGHISSLLVNRLLRRLSEQRRISTKDVSSALYAVGQIAKNGTLEGTLDTDTLEHLCNAMVRFRDLDALGINNAVHGFVLLVEANALHGSFDKRILEALLRASLRVTHFDKACIVRLLSDFQILIQKHSFASPQVVIDLTGLLNLLCEKSLSVAEAMQTLDKLVSLKDQCKIEGKHLYHLINVGLSRPHFSSLDGARLIHILVEFQHHHELLNPLFQKLCSFPLSATALFSSTKDQLMSDIKRLKIADWQHVLQRKFSEVRAPLRIKPWPVSSAHVPLQAAPKNPILFSPPTSIRKPVGLTHKVNNKITKEDWIRACQNKVFAAIANKNLELLDELLGLLFKATHTVPAEKRVPAANVMHSSPSLLHKLFQKHHTKKSEDKHEVGNSLTKDFLQKTDPEPLRRLIEISEASYFKKLLHACSAHVRYQLAVENSLNPILLYLPINELKSMVQGFIQPQGLGIYRDHLALLHLIEALKQRAKDNPTQKATILSLQKDMLERALAFHEETNHIHVVDEIEVKLKQVLIALKDKTVQAVQAGSSAESSQKTTSLQPARPEQRINSAYQYESEDIEAILRVRMLNIPNVDVLAGALMNEGQENNRVADVLKLNPLVFFH